MSYDDTNSRLDTQIDELSNFVWQKPKIAKNPQVGQVGHVHQKLDMFIKIHYCDFVQKKFITSDELFFIVNEN